MQDTLHERPRWRLAPLGDAALLAEAVGDQLAANLAALAAADALEADPPPGFLAAVPAIASLLLCFDPLSADVAGLEHQLRELLDSGARTPSIPGRLVEIAVRFGGDHGPDLEQVAQTLNLTPTALVEALCAEPRRVMMIGFAPGYPYIGPLPPALHLPRRATPRPAVPAGSVASAAGLIGIYPTRLPGGWHLLGQTRLCLFDPGADPPATLRPGDMVQLVAE